MQNLDANEKRLLIAGAKAMYSASPKKDDKIYFADIVLRLESGDKLDKVSKHFAEMFTDKVIERTEKLIVSGTATEEAMLRASIVKETYAAIKEKLNDKTK